MSSIFQMNLSFAFAMLIAINLVCIMLGMGVPFFPILFGFPLGWYLAKRATASGASVPVLLRRVFIHALIIPAVTFVVMLAIWGRTATLLSDPATDFEYFGVPMILYDPRLSFIGWLVLMIVISPFLQLLTTVFSAYLTLLRWSKNAPNP
jgi:hypothetical protein